MTDVLTPRQKQIVELVVKGRSSKAIAEALLISKRTVDRTVENAMVRLGISKRTALGRALGELAALPFTEAKPPNNGFLLAGEIVGREVHIAEILASLVARRPAVITGPSGVGKSRLAHEVARRFLEQTPAKAYILEFDGFAPSDSLSAFVARSIGIEGEATNSVVKSIAAASVATPLLLILDTCDRIVGDLASFLRETLTLSTNVYILATSQLRLPLRGAVHCSLPPPSISECIDIFINAIVAVSGSFQPEADDRETIRRICERLGNNPLAIEIAAEQLRPHFGLPEIESRLDERFLSVVGAFARSARHMSFDAALRWTFDLLPQPQQLLLTRLSVFCNGFTYESAAAVFAHFDECRAAVEDGIVLLVDLRLIQPSAYRLEAQIRFFMPDLTRAFAMRQLRAGGEAESLLRHHAWVFAEVAEQFQKLQHNMSYTRWFDIAEPELQNVKSALDWAFRNDEATGKRLIVALATSWVDATCFDGKRWLERALEYIDDSAAHEIDDFVLFAYAGLCRSLGEYRRARETSLRLLDRTLERGGGDMHLRVKILLGRMHACLGVAESSVILDEALAEARSLGNHGLLASALDASADAALRSSESRRADRVRTYANESLEIYRSFGAERLAASTLQTLAEAEFLDGDLECAIAITEDANAVFLKYGIPGSTAYVRNRYATYLLLAKKSVVAAPLIFDAVAFARTAQFKRIGLIALDNLVHAMFDRPAASAENYEDCARICGFTAACLRLLGSARSPVEDHVFDRNLEALQAVLGARPLGRLLEHGAAMNEDYIFDIALAFRRDMPH